MNDDLFTVLTAQLASMKGNPWTTSHFDSYMLGLSDLPDDAGMFLARELLQRWEWRPSVKELRDYWHQISSLEPPQSADEIVAELMHLRAKFGPYAMKTKHSVTGVTIYAKGEPEWTKPILQRVVATLGGWVNFCESDDPDGVIRGQMLKIAGSIIADGGTERLQQLRIEYKACQEQQAQLEKRGLRLTAGSL